MTITHRMCGAKGRATPTYVSWEGAKCRCSWPGHKQWSDYGGRGIEFHFPSVLDLVAEIGERPPATSLDRIDNDGHYEPGNVRWATPTQQARNRRCQKLDIDRARQIRQRGAAGKPQLAIAREFDVSQSWVQRILAGEVWKEGVHG